MNNQVKLIDADKLLKWLEESESNWYSRKYGEYGEGHVKAYSNVADAVESGDFDPDTPPVPTIKPGDKVRHKIYGIGELIWISDNQNYGLFQKGYENAVKVFIQDLEVVE